MKYKEKLKEFISETYEQILQKKNDINNTRIDYHKKKCIIDSRFRIVVLLLIITLIVGLYYMNWYCITGSFVIGILSYLYVEDMKTKTFKVIMKKIRFLHKELKVLYKLHTEAQDEGWLPSSHQIHGEVTYM